MFYELQETPGLGARITRNAWRSKWPGRRIYDDSGEVALRLVSKPPPAEEAEIGSRRRSSPWSRRNCASAATGSPRSG